MIVKSSQIDIFLVYFTLLLLQKLRRRSCCALIMANAGLMTNATFTQLIFQVQKRSLVYCSLQFQLNVLVHRLDILVTRQTYWSCLTDFVAPWIPD